MNALILQGTLKREGLSNTQTLSEFFAEKLQKVGVECEIVRLSEHTILPGTYQDMGGGDEWPAILEKILDADIIVFATPVWWGGHSSEIQRVIERLDAIHDDILAGRKSPLEGKVGGIIVTGDSDGAEHIIGSISNFFNALGLTLPAYASLTVLWEGQAKGAETTREELMEKYEEDYSQKAETMVQQLLRWSRS